MSSLDKILRLTGAQPEPEMPEPELLAAARAGARELSLYLAADDDPDDDGDDDSSGKDGGKGDTDDDAGHVSHATFKALTKKGVPDKRAAAMCAKADKKVKASALADSLQVILAGLAEPAAVIALAAGDVSEDERKKGAREGWALPDGSYPIKDKKHLHSAATLAASGHGNVSAAKRLIRKRARELGVDVKSLPGFGGSDAQNEKVAATMVALAAGKGIIVAMHHPPYTGTHSHPHHLTAAHEHEHQHFQDNSHEGGPAHRPGSAPIHTSW